MNGEQIIGGRGTVIINSINEKNERQAVTFNLAPLTIGEELDLDGELKSLVDAERSERRDQQLNEVGAKAGTWAHKQFISELVRFVMEAPSVYDVNAKRYDLAGVRSELWHRAKKTQPALSRDEVAACVTVQNVLEVRDKIDKAINPITPHKSESGPVPAK